jgi:hypothetical protein
VRLAGGAAISRRYRRAKALHWRSVEAPFPTFTAAALGASSGYQTSYQLPEACCAFGTPRGG